VSLGEKPAPAPSQAPAPNLTYTPAANYSGSDAFTFTANDGTLDSNVATVSITAGNTAPVAADLSVGTAFNTAVHLTLTASDPDGNPLTFAVVTAPVHGILSGTAPNQTYTPAAGYRGTDSFIFKANDGTVDSEVAQGCSCSSNGPVSPAAYLVPLSLLLLGLARSRRRVARSSEAHRQSVRRATNSAS